MPLIFKALNYKEKLTLHYESDGSSLSIKTGTLEDSVVQHGSHSWDDKLVIAVPYTNEWKVLCDS